METIYYWAGHDAYCYHSELKNFTYRYGHDYTVYERGYFLLNIWGKDKC